MRTTSAFRWTPGLALSLFAMGQVTSQAEQNQSDAVAALLTEFEQVEARWSDELRAWKQRRTRLRSEGKLAELPDPPRHPFAEFAPRVRRFAEREGDRAVPALLWLIRPTGMADAYAEPVYPDGVRFALDRCARDHAGDERMHAAVRHLCAARYLVDKIGLEPIDRFLTAVRDHPHSAETRGAAAYALGLALDRAVRLDAGGAEAPVRVERMRECFAEAAESGPGRLRPLAQRFVDEIDTLQVGMPAPETAGTDTAGRAISLVDFRGRVVLLDFWGFW